MSDQTNFDLFLTEQQFQNAADELPGIDARALYINNVLHRFCREYLAALDRELSIYDLALSRHVLLNAVNMHHPNGITPVKLVQIIGITSGAATGLIDSLENDGYIERKRTDTDRRRVTLVMTKKGKNKIRKYYPRHSQRVSRFIDAINNSEQKALIKLMQKLRESLPRLTEIQGE